MYVLPTTQPYTQEGYMKLTYNPSAYFNCWRHDTKIFNMKPTANQHLTLSAKRNEDTKEDTKEDKDKSMMHALCILYCSKVPVGQKQHLTVKKSSS